MKTELPFQEARARLIVALDVSDIRRALALVSLLRGRVGGFKIGLELSFLMLAMVAAPDDDGEAFDNFRKVRELFAMLRGERVFWDVKFDDIPHTVAGATKAIQRLKAFMFTVHASAGSDAMEAAATHKAKSLTLAVTVLTSLPANKRVVLKRARAARKAGFDGVVCSAREAKLIRGDRKLSGLILVTPGIRDEDAPPDDQKRATTATEAILAGADYLVIGRPIINQDDPAAVAEKLVAKIAFANKR